MGPCGKWLCDQDKKEELTKPIPYLRELVNFGHFWPQFSWHFWLYFENKSMKSNLIRKSMKLYFSELGNIFSTIFTIIWAFTALWVINSNEMAIFVVLLKKLQKCHRNDMFKDNISSNIWSLANFSQFWLNQSWFPKLCHFLAIHLSESCKIPDNRENLGKNVA